MHVAQHKTTGERGVVRAPSTGLPMGQGTALPYFFEYRVSWKKDLGRMFYELARMDLSGRQWRLAERLVKCTLGRGYLGLYVPNWDFLARSLRWKAKDVGDVLNGYSEKDKSGVLRSVKGLVELGIVRVRRCGLDKGFVLVLVPAVSRWDVAALYSPAEDAAWLAEVDAVRLAFAAQPECAVIAEQFPDLASEVDGMHAAAVLAVRAPSATCMPRPVDARQVAVSAPVARLTALARCAQDARPVDVSAPRVAGGACAPVVRGDSHYGKAENFGNGGAITRMGRVAGVGLKAEAKDPKLKIILKSWKSYSLEQKKDALHELETCRDGDRIRRIIEIILGDDVAAGDAGKWIVRMRSHSKQVVQALTKTIEDMVKGNVTRAGGLAHLYGAEYGLWPMPARKF